MNLSTMWPWALGAVLLLALLILIVLVLLLRRSSKSSDFVDAEEPQDDDAAPKEKKPLVDGPVADIPDAFRRAASLIDRAADGDRKNVPLFLLVGDGGSRDADLLGSAGLELTWGGPAEAGTSLGEGKGFWVFDRGVVLDVAGETDEETWEAVLGQLQRLRPKRPIDGVIVTLSCNELLDATGSEVKRTDLASRATRLYRKLWEAQQKLGFRLPTYVLVTGCEKLTGFGSLCASLSDQSRRQIFGWSNPNGIEAVYRGSWIDEAFDAIVRRLEDVQLEVFAEGTREGDSLLRLSPALASLATSVKPTLEALFKSSAYHGTLIFRGLYFCGREKTPAADVIPDSDNAFLAEVLDRKVFIEHRLASPTARTVMARNRSVTIAKIATAASFLLATLSLLWAGYTFHRQNLILEPLLSHAAESMETQSGRTLSSGELGRSATLLLNDMSAIDFNRYDSIVVPVSWFAPFHDSLENALTDAFHDIILRAIRSDLVARSKNLIPLDEGRIVPLVPVIDPADAEASRPGPASAPLITMTSGTGMPVEPGADGTSSALADATITAPPAWADDAVVPLSSMDEFIRLREYAKQIRELDEQISGFNSLHSTGDLRQIGRLVKYSFGLELPNSFYTKGHLYRHAMQAAQYKKLDPNPATRDAAVRKLNLLANDFHESLFRRNPFAARLQVLSSSIQTVTWQPPQRGDTQPLQSIAEQLKRIDGDLSGPDLEWAFKREFDLGAEYNAMLGDITSTSYLGKPVASQIRDATAARWGRFQQALTWASSPLTKTILSVHEERPEMHLSKESLLLQSALQTFLGQAFIASAHRSAPPRSDLPDGVRLTWNGTALEQAVAVAQAYDRFRSGTLALFPADGRVSVDQVARERALADMLDLLQRAQVYEVVGHTGSASALDEQIRPDITRFTSQVPALETVLDACSRLSPEAGRIVGAAMGAEANRLLRNLDRLVALETPYATKVDFADWDGTTPASPLLWRAEDQPSMEASLEATRSRLAYEATAYAKPLITWLVKAEGGTRPETRERIAEWQEILDDLRDYEAKKPGNAVAVLEDYIGVKMAKVTAADCTGATLPAGFRGRSLFARTAVELSRNVRQRCLELAGRDASSRYALLERYFNQRLAGRYPFADGLPKKNDQEADPADLRAFFKLFDAHRAVIAAAADHGGLEAKDAAARKFVEDMTGVRAFFASFLDAPKAELAPSVDVEATFRVLKPKEIEGDQIIGWRFGIDEQSINNRQTNRKLRWTAGQELSFELRWANDAPRVPVAAGQAYAAVDGRRIMWRYANRWALLAALADHPTRSDELPAYADVQPVTMAFDLSTVPAEGPLTEMAPTRVFLRLAVLAPGTNQPLDVPRFPVRAPRIATEEAVR